MGKISKRGLGSLVSTRGLTVFASSLITRKVCSSQAQISHTFMEMFLNLIYFTVSYFIEILTSLFWFFSTVNFAFTLLLKTYVVLATKLSWIFKIFSLWRTVSFSKHQLLALYELPNSRPTQNISEGARDLFILMESATIYIQFRSW